MPSKTIEDFAYQVRDYMRSAEVVEGKNHAYSQENNAVIATIENGKSYKVRWTGSATVTLKKNSASGTEVTSGSTSPLSFTADSDFDLYFGSSADVTEIMVYDGNDTSDTYEPYYVPVKDRFDYVKIAEATENQTWSAQLSTLHTAYSALSDEDKMRCVVSAGDNFAYGKYSLQAVLAEAFAMNTLDGYGKFNAICMRLSNQTAKMVNIVSNGTITLTDLSSETNTIKLVLYITP